MKVKVSFDGRNNNETWTVVRFQEHEPHVIIRRHSRKLHIIFETHSERERFHAGIALCRAKYNDDGKIRTLYLTGVRP